MPTTSLLFWNSESRAKIQLTVPKCVSLTGFSRSIKNEFNECVACSWEETNAGLVRWKVCRECLCMCAMLENVYSFVRIYEPTHKHIQYYEQNKIFIAFIMLECNESLRCFALLRSTQYQQQQQPTIDF